MRKFIFLGFLLISLIFLYSLQKTNLQTENQPKTDDTVLGIPADDKEYYINNYKFDYYKVNDISALSLIPNFDEKLTSEQLIEKLECKFLTNAGFYSRENKPLGLFTYNYKTRSSEIKSSLFNSFLSINDFDTPRITRVSPLDRLRIALQSGPLLKENAKFLIVKSSNDKKARRILAGVSGENELYFFAIYNKDQLYDGPLLSELPTLVGMIEDKLGVEFADVINLDGGSASLFYSPKLYLKELTFSGGFFCEAKD